MKHLALFSLLFALLTACSPATQSGAVQYQGERDAIYNTILAGVASTPVQASMIETAVFEVTTENRDAGVISAKFDFQQGGSTLTQTATFRVSESGGATAVNYQTSTTGSTTSTADRLVNEILQQLDQSFQRA